MKAPITPGERETRFRVAIALYLLAIGFTFADFSTIGMIFVVLMALWFILFCISDLPLPNFNKLRLLGREEKHDER